MQFLNYNYETITHENGLQTPVSIFCSARFKGSESSTESVPTTSPGQQATEQAISDFLTPRIGQGATPFTGKLTADIPDLVGESFKKFTSAEGLSSEARSQLESLATGESFFQSDPAGIIQDWRENFANPLTSYYNEFVRPEVREEFNVPGGFNTSERSEGVSRAFNEFYGSRVAPTLFQAQENERQREFAAASQARNLQLPAIQYQQGLPTLELSQNFGAATDFQRFEQTGLDARYNEFLRTALENDPFTKLGIPFALSATRDTIVEQGGGGTNFGALAGAGLGAVLAGSVTGGLGAGQGAALGATIGGASGF